MHTHQEVAKNKSVMSNTRWARKKWCHTSHIAQMPGSIQFHVTGDNLHKKVKRWTNNRSGARNNIPENDARLEINHTNVSITDHSICSGCRSNETINNNFRSKPKFIPTLGQTKRLSALNDCFIAYYSHLFEWRWIMCQSRCKNINIIIPSDSFISFAKCFHFLLEIFSLALHLNMIGLYWRNDNSDTQRTIFICARALSIWVNANVRQLHFQCWNEYAAARNMFLHKRPRILIFSASKIEFVIILCTFMRPHASWHLNVMLSFVLFLLCSPFTVESI